MDDKIIEYIIIFPLVSWRKGVCLRQKEGYKFIENIFKQSMVHISAWTHCKYMHVICTPRKDPPNAYCIDNARMNISIHIHAISQCDKYGARAHFPSRRFSFFLYIILESGSVHCISRSRNIAFDGLDFITGKISSKPWQLFICLTIWFNGAITRQLVKGDRK